MGAAQASMFVSENLHLGRRPLTAADLRDVARELERRAEAMEAAERAAADANRPAVSVVVKRPMTAQAVSLTRLARSRAAVPPASQRSVSVRDRTAGATPVPRARTPLLTPRDVGVETAPVQEAGSDVANTHSGVVWFSKTDDVTLVGVTEALFRLLNGMLSKPQYVNYVTGNESIHLRDYIRKMIRRAQVPLCCAVTALIYLRRFRAAYPQARCKHGSAHRLFLTAFMLGTKFNEDETYTSQSWTEIGIYIPLKDLNECESELLRYLDFRLGVTVEEYRACVASIVNPPPAAPPVVTEVVQPPPVTSATVVDSTSTGSTPAEPITLSSWAALGQKIRNLAGY